LGKIDLADIVNMPAFEEAGALFYKATGMTLSFYNDHGDVIFYPSVERCEFCRIIQSSHEGSRRCQLSDIAAAEAALTDGKPRAYTCHAGLIDVVVPVVVGDNKIGCFYSGQSLLSPTTSMSFDEIKSTANELALDADSLWQAYIQVHIVDEQRLEVAMGLLGVICNHLVDSEIALRRERLLTVEQRRLRKSAEEKALLERDLREMELRLVQAQLNPHFLFNALNLILGNAMAEKAPKTRELVENLSVMLRSSLAQLGKLVPLREEIAGATACVDIHLARFRKMINYQVNLPDALAGFEVPPLILQPLVENSLVHGLVEGNEFSMSIDVTSSNGTIEICVSDNGRGILPLALEQLRSELHNNKHEGKTTGLAGLARRLAYYYPGKSKLTVDSDGAGVVVKISIPQNQ
jgi:ligand-binding sensor protein